MWCDFTDGLVLVSALPLMPAANFPLGQPPPVEGCSPPGHPPFPPGGPGKRPGDDPTIPSAPPGWVGSQRTFPSISFEALQAGAWHDHSPGLGGVRIHYWGLVTFFDPRLSSLVESRKNQTRGQFRLEGINEEDVALVQAELREVLERQDAGSGVEWGFVLRNVIDRNAQRLEYLKYILDGKESKVFNATEVASRARRQVLTMLAPYLLRTSLPPSTPSSSINKSQPNGSPRWENTTWVAEAIHHCGGRFTSHIPFNSLTPQEVRLRHATQEVVYEICRMLGVIWVDAFVVEELEVEEVEGLVVKWRNEIKGLMSWLDWSEWIRCEPACALDVSCSIWFLRCAADAVLG